MELSAANAVVVIYAAAVKSAAAVVFPA
jgi:hypothetical protein